MSVQISMPSLNHFEICCYKAKERFTHEGEARRVISPGKERLGVRRGVEVVTGSCHKLQA